MMNLKSLCAIVLASLSILAVGCGSGGGSGSYTPQSYGSTSASSPHFNIQTTNTSTSGGSSEVWGGVTITGYAHPFTIPCDVTSDSNCIPNVGDVIDVGNGNGALNQNKINAFATDGTFTPTLSQQSGLFMPTVQTIATASQPVQVLSHWKIQVMEVRSSCVVAQMQRTWSPRPAVA